MAVLKTGVKKHTKTYTWNVYNVDVNTTTETENVYETQYTIEETTTTMTSFQADDFINFVYDDSVYIDDEQVCLSSYNYLNVSVGGTHTLPLQSIYYFYYNTGYNTNTIWKVTVPDDVDEVWVYRSASSGHDWISVNYSIPSSYTSKTATMILLYVNSKRILVDTIEHTTTTYSCGSTLKNTLTSYNPNKYPKNNKSGNYWYVRQ